MQVSDIIPIGERSILQDPMQRASRACQDCQNSPGIEKMGQTVLKILRDSESKLTVGEALNKKADDHQTFMNHVRAFIDVMENLTPVVYHKL